MNTLKQPLERILKELDLVIKKLTMYQNTALANKILRNFKIPAPANITSAENLTL